MSFRWSDFQICKREVEDLQETVRSLQNQLAGGRAGPPPTTTGKDEMASWAGYLIAGIVLALLVFVWRVCRYLLRHPQFWHRQPPAPQSIELQELPPRLPAPPQSVPPTISRVVSDEPPPLERDLPLLL